MVPIGEPRPADSYSMVTTCKREALKKKVIPAVRPAILCSFNLTQ